MIALTAPALPSNSNESSFLPSSYESIKAMNLQEGSFPAAFAPAAEVLIQRTDGHSLTTADRAQVLKVNKQPDEKNIDQVQAIIPGAVQPRAERAPQRGFSSAPSNWRYNDGCISQHIDHSGRSTASHNDG